METIPVLKACIRARAALAELKAVGALIPDQAVLINSIPLLEAQASSEIENIVTTSDRLFRFAGQGFETGADPATKEALRYRTALAEGFQRLSARPLTTVAAVEICRTIKGADIDVRATSGTALINDATKQVVYTPPEGGPSYVISSPTGSNIYTRLNRIRIRLFASRSNTISLKPSIPSAMATAAPAVC